MYSDHLVAVLEEVQLGQALLDEPSIEFVRDLVGKQRMHFSVRFNVGTGLACGGNLINGLDLSKDYMTMQRQPSSTFETRSSRFPNDDFSFALSARFSTPLSKGDAPNRVMMFRSSDAPKE